MRVVSIWMYVNCCALRISMEFNEILTQIFSNTPKYKTHVFHIFVQIFFTFFSHFPFFAFWALRVPSAHYNVFGLRSTYGGRTWCSILNTCSYVHQDALDINIHSPPSRALFDFVVWELQMLSSRLSNPWALAVVWVGWEAFFTLSEFVGALLK